MIRPGHKFRVGVLLGACMLVYLCVLARLFWVQIMKSDFFVGMAAQQYLVGVFGANPRGTIFDRHGQQLVLNKEIFSAFVLPNTAHDRDELLNFLHQYYPPVLNRILNHPERYFFWLERRLTPERYAWLKEQKLNCIQFATESVRYYPYKELAHVLGFTDIDNHGIAGLELSLNKQLAGEAAKYRMAKDARAKRYYFERTTEKEGVASDAVHITIDHKLQFLLYHNCNIIRI
jgi:cell division protein FtsI/penicillin-binding protein 2